MSDLRKAAQMVLETWDADDWFDAGTLRAAIAQPEPAALEDIPACMFCGELIEPAAPTVVEPVGWLEAPYGGFKSNPLYRMTFPPASLAWKIPLYTTPPRAALTDEEIRDLWSWSATHEAERTATTQQHAFARAIEAAHGIGGPK